MDCLKIKFNKGLCDKNLGVKGKMNKSYSKRWLYLVLGTIVMLVVGVIYAWSILKIPLADEFQWGVSQLALNFTITMCFFCLGNLAGSRLQQYLGARKTLFIAAIAILLGFFLTSRSQGHFVIALYVTYMVYRILIIH